MGHVLSRIGRGVGWIGIALCAIAGVARIRGAYELAGYQTITFLLAGIALVAAGCFLRLEGRSGN